MKSFDQYMAETGRQGELDSLRKNFGYDKAKSAYESSGGYGGSGISGSSPSGSSVNYGDILGQVKNSISSSLDPIVAQIKSQQPAISQAYTTAKSTLEGQKSSLSTKYQQLLADIKNNGKVQTDTATKTTNNELARRGITSDSTAAGQELSSVLNPIQNTITSQEGQATTAQGQEENDLANQIANLGISEQGAQGNILSQVAQILSGGAPQATNAASGIYSQLLGNQQQTAMADKAAQQTDAQKAYAQLQNQLLQSQLDMAKATAPLDIQKLQAEIAKLKSTGSGLSSSALSGLW
jgi:hypothetical protein